MQCLKAVFQFSHHEQCVKAVFQFSQYEQCVKAVIQFSHYHTGRSWHGLYPKIFFCSKQWHTQLVAKNQIQKFEINPDNVDFYFDEFDSRERCFAFEVEQSDIEVSNPKPALIKVYDYYEIKDSVMTQYEIKTICGTKEELPFPELWEPYWRFYDDNGQRRLPSEELGSAPGPVLTCPVCTEVVDVSSEDFKMMVCQAEAVYKTTVGRSEKYSIKITTNFTNEGKRRLQIFVKPVMGSQCQCSVLGDTENKALILTPLSLLDTEAKELTLNARSTLIHWSNLVEKSIHKILTKQDSAC